MNRIFIKGDCHRNFKWIESFCKENNTTKEDLMIILGDAGINYFTPEIDAGVKDYLQNQPITFFIIQGNHEKRAKNLSIYTPIKDSRVGGVVYIQYEYPNLLFADNGVYHINNKKFLVADGAYSVDKKYRIANNLGWFKDEQMSDEDMERLFKIADEEKSFDYVLSHAAPLSKEPTYLFMPGLEQSMIDKHTEWILDEIYNKIEFEHWFFGHYHDDNLDYKSNMSILYHKIINLEEFMKEKENENIY